MTGTPGGMWHDCRSLGEILDSVATIGMFDPRGRQGDVEFLAAAAQQHAFRGRRP